MVDAVVMSEYLAARDLCVVWGVLSEKSAWDGHSHVGGISNQSAVYLLEEDGSISGGHTMGERMDPEM
ncbi:hypothetical protein D9M71_721350 [compost metagenome]